MAKIAFFHNALGKTDGVSLEVDKWRACLEEEGHTVLYCAGNDDAKGVYCIPELSFFHPISRKILENATVKLVDYTEDELKHAILEQKEVIKTQLLQFINENRVEILIPNNLLSVGYHLPALIALSEVIEETELPTIAHNHDFYFEESGEVHPTCEVAQAILDKYVPPAFPNVRNIVINRIAQGALKERKGIEARVVPNVFDFSQPAWKEDEFNSDFRETFGIRDNDIVFLQATRVMDRKGIELAIDLLAELEKDQNRNKLSSQPLYNGRQFTGDSKFILLCAGHIEEFGASGDYVERLKARAEKLGVDLRFVGHRIKHSRGSSSEGKIFSLWDSYVHADFVTYPSLWEGWGNQFIEAIFAKLPVAVFEYPVFTSDLAGDGFAVVSLGNEASRSSDGLATVAPAILSQAAEQVINLLVDGDKRSAAVDINFNRANERYSYSALKKIIATIFSELKL